MGCLFGRVKHEVQTIDFIHPEDAAALETLKKIPVLPVVIKSFMELVEQLKIGLKTASKARLSPILFPELYHILPSICELTDIKEPVFYLEMSPIPNEYVFGDTQTAIAFTSALVEMMSEEELRGAVPHECRHIACLNRFYHTLAQIHNR